MGTMMGLLIKKEGSGGNERGREMRGEMCCFFLYIFFPFFVFLIIIIIIIMIETIPTKIIKKELSKNQIKMRRTKLGADRSPHLLDFSMRKVKQIRKSNQFYPSQNTKYIQTKVNKGSNKRSTTWTTNRQGILTLELR